MNINQMELTSNEADTDLTTRISKAKQFLQENPDEHISTAARIYNVKWSTLQSSIKRQPTGSRGG